MATSGLLAWTLGHVLPITLVSSVMLGVLVLTSGTARWSRRLLGPWPIDKQQPSTAEAPDAETPGGTDGRGEGRVAIMMSMLRGFDVFVAAMWLVQGGLALLAAVALMAGALGSGHLFSGVGGGVGALALGTVSLLLGNKLLRWRPRRGEAS